jgi:hypothetical protein
MSGLGAAALVVLLFVPPVSALTLVLAVGGGVCSALLSALAFLSVVAQPFRRNPKSRTNKVEYLEERIIFKM